MKRIRKLLAVVIALGMVCSINMVAFAQDSLPPNSQPSSGDSKEGYYLEDKESITYEQDGYIITDTYRVFKPIVQSRSGEQEVTHVVTKVVGIGWPGNDVLFTAQLDADFIYNSTTNTVECPRYYSSYTDGDSMRVPPYESDMEYKTGTTSGKSCFKLRAKTTYVPTSVSNYFWMAIGCDSSGKKLTSY